MKWTRAGANHCTICDDTFIDGAVVELDVGIETDTRDRFIGLAHTACVQEVKNEIHQEEEQEGPDDTQFDLDLQVWLKEE